MDPTRTDARTAAGGGSGPRTGSIDVDGLEIYHEIHGDGPPLVLLHGAMGTIDVCFADLLPGLAEHHMVIAVELQGHGRTPDIDRPLTYPRLAADVAGLMAALGIAAADLVGYSMGGAVGLQLALDRPELVRRVIWYGGINFDPAGLHPEMLADLRTVTVEQVAGTPWHDAYLAVAPDPAGWPRLVARIAEFDRTYTGWDPARLRGISVPTLLIAGDADLSRPEHVVEMFRLFGGGVLGDLHPLPAARLGIVPGASHVGVLAQTAVLQAMILPFLAADPPAPSETG